jgi:type II secretory pathway pseudopilin PulG
MKMAGSLRPSLRQNGFTFVEILAALTFMAILVPVLVSALTLANRTAEIADRTSTAMQLGENQLSQLLIGNNWQSAGGSGDFGASWPGYQWKVDQTPWPQDNNNAMIQLTMHVTFPVQGSQREIQLTTLVSTSLLQPGSTNSSTGSAS